jgi:DNA (cytosine-5)-methyltransferase 1
MTHGSVFTGIGGFDWAAQQLDIDNIFNCEINQFCRKSLKYHYPNSIQYGAIEQTDFSVHRGKLDILSGGFPCQDASNAKQWGEGKQGLRGSRTGLAFHMLRAVDEANPKVVVAENVSDFLEVNNGEDFRTILGELAGMGYNAEWRVCYASEVGAPQNRRRLYLVAYSSDIRLPKGQTFFSYVQETSSQVAWVAHGTSIQTFRGGYWNSEPPTICVDDGVPCELFGLSTSQYRKEQLMAYGNAVIPQIPFAIFKKVKELI